jgi:DNA-binding CsgD family transcriptional regulator
LTVVVSSDARPRASAPAFVGRTAALATVAELLERAQRGEGRPVFVTGPAGSGKTSLLRQVTADAARRGFEVVGVRASSRRGPRPLEPFRSALRELERSALAGPAALACDALREHFARMAEVGPVLLTVDDLDAVDAATSAVVLFLMRHLRHDRVAIVASGRDDRLAADVADGGRRMIESGRAEMIRLEGFDHGELAELVRSRAGVMPHDDFVHALRERSGGLPFLAVALLDALVTAGLDPTSAHDAERAATLALPRRSSTVVLHRVFELGPDARVVASAASVVGRACIDRLALVGEVTGLDGDRTLSAFDRLVSAGVLVDRGEEFDFAHPIVRDALYGDLAPATRRVWHARLAALLAERRSAARPREILEIAEHLHAAGGRRDGAAAQLFREAGDIVVREDPLAAASWYEAALARLAPSDDGIPALQLAMGRALDLSGRHEMAARLTVAALRRLGPGIERERGAIAAARAATDGGRFDLAEQFIGEAVAGESVVGDGAPASALLLERGRLRFWQGDLAGAAADLDAARAADRAAGSAPLADVLELDLSLSRGDARRAAVLHHQLRRRVDDLDVAIRPTVQLALDRAAAFDLDPSFGGRAELGGRSRFAPAWQPALAAQAMWRHGRIADAQVAARALCEPGVERPSDLARCVALAVWIRTAVESRNLEEAAGAVAQARALSRVPLPHVLDGAIARFLVVTGDHDEALRLVSRAVRRESAFNRLNVMKMCLADEVDVAVAAGALDHARAANARLQRMADDGASVAATLWLLLSQASAERDATAARVARDIAVAHGLAFDAARALAIWGAVDGDRDAVAAARSELSRMGATTTLRDVGEWTRGGGGRRARRRRGEVLSGDERRLISLVAEGLTNREIGRRMSLSTKTVEVYLSRIYAKTRCRSRVELALAVQHGRVAQIDGGAVSGLGGTGDTTVAVVP